MADVSVAPGDPPVLVPPHETFMNLTRLADRFVTDKGGVDGDRHLYTEFYATCFESLRRQEFCLLELGLLRCANRAEEHNPAGRSVQRIPSIEMWLEYFPKARCYGFDIADFSACQKERFEFIRGDLSVEADIEFLAQIVPDLRIIIDDASHASFHQQRALLRLFSKLEPGGFYAIEDLHYSPPFESSLPPCRPLSKIVADYLRDGVLTLDFASAEECKALSEQIGHCFVHCSDRGAAQWGPKLVIFQKKVNALGAAESESVRRAAALPPIDATWISSRMFAFRGGHNRGLYAAALRFEPNGRITGYRHQNETFWKYADGMLTILRNDGLPTCIATPVRNVDGTVSFVGRFLLVPGDIPHRFDEHPLGNGPPMVFSFDLFDTLVARRCYEPKAIFRRVEEKSGVDGFARRRAEEEYKLWQAGDYNFDDIYAVLGEATGWPAALLQRLRMLELAEEWDNLFPIREIVQRVRSEDLIISDMYLPLSFLRRVVEEKCGLEGRLIHLSSHGKTRGEVWQKIRSTHRIMRHHGDNQHSDIESARRAGLSAEHVTLSQWTRGEQVLNGIGLTGFAQIIREARLSSFDADPTARAAQVVQFDVNLPLLLVASLYVLQKAAQNAVDTLLMCSRDCNLWLHLMTWLAARTPAAPTVRYLVTSRVLLLSESTEYYAYFSQLRGTRSMLVDVSGTGRSPAHFLKSIGAQETASVFLLAGTTGVGTNFVRTLAPAHDEVAIDILSQQPHEQRLGIESLNMSLEPRAHQMVFNGQSFEVVPQPSEFGRTSQALIATMRTAFLDALTRLTNAGLRVNVDGVPLEALQSAADELIGIAGDYRRAFAPILQDINQEEESIARIALAERERNRLRAAGE